MKRSEKKKTNQDWTVRHESWRACLLILLHSMMKSVFASNLFLYYIRILFSVSSSYVFLKYVRTLHQACSKWNEKNYLANIFVSIYWIPMIGNKVKSIYLVNLNDVLPTSVRWHGNHNAVNKIIGIKQTAAIEEILVCTVRIVVANNNKQIP